MVDVRVCRFDVIVYSTNKLLELFNGYIHIGYIRSSSFLFQLCPS